MHKCTAGSPLLFTGVYLESRLVLTEGLSNSVHVPAGYMMAALAGIWHGSVVCPVSNCIPSDLSPNGLWKPGVVLEGDEIYQGYSERFSLKFPAQCQVVYKSVHERQCVSECA